MNRRTISGVACLLFIGTAILQVAAACGGDHEAPPALHDGSDGASRPSDAGDAADARDARTMPGDSGSSFDASEAAADPCLPFTMPTADVLFASPRKVLAHDFNFFALSIDNEPAATDYYSTEWLVPDGEESVKGVPDSGAHFWNGGYLRTRPLPVTPSSASDWASGAGQTLNVEREIRLALGRGITGFVFEILGMDDVNLSTSSKNDNHLEYAMAAATAVDSRFKLVLMPDIASLSNSNTQAQVISDVTLIVETYYDATKYPALLHSADGRLVVSPFYANLIPASAWQTMEQQLTAAGYPIYFVPVFLSLETTYVQDYQSISDGLGDWGTALPGQNTWIPANATATHANTSAKGAVEIYMAGLSGQDYRPKDFSFTEAQGNLSYTQGWLGAIDQKGAASSHPDWIQLTTWSDFSETTQVEPYTDLSLDLTIGTGYYDLTGYYASWFLTGKQPAITHDVLYYFYRKETVAAAAAAPNTGCKSAMTGIFTQPCPTTDAVPDAPGVDTIFLLAFLTEPGTLSITIGGKTLESALLPAGIQSFSAPLAAGTPTFALTRDKVSVISFTGHVEVAGASGLSTGYPDLTYWTGSASASGTCSLDIP
jgi:Glycosyl hydrolase family 71